MANPTYTYSDLDLTFTRQPATGDVSILKDSRSVTSAVRNLLLTNYYDRSEEHTSELQSH